MTFAATNMAGMTMAFPNVCLTPAAPSPIPVPYPSIGQCATATASTCSLKVKILNKNVMTTKSEVPKTQGDEAGTAGGVTSGTFGAVCKRTLGSMKVMVEGAPMVTMLQLIGSNGPSPNAPVGNHLVPSQTKVICLG